jgi:hypothetical protein
MDDESLYVDSLMYGGAGGDPYAGGSNGGNSSPSGTNTSYLSSLFSSSGNVLTQALKNQSTAAQQKLAAKLGVAQATNSNNTLKIVIIAVIGLVAVGLAFAFLKSSKKG